MDTLLSALAMPVVTLLSQGATIREVVHTVLVKDCITLFRRDLPANLYKYPVFEVTYAVLAFTPMVGSRRGLAAGFLLSTTMLPLMNYRSLKNKQLMVLPFVL